MFVHTEALVLFPTYLWAHQLSPQDCERINAPIRAKLKSLQANFTGEVPKQGWQTHQNLHQLPEFQELTRLIMSAARGVVDFLKIAEEGIEITGCWANINPQGATNPWHIHPNNYLGGVYYVDMPEEAAAIAFQDPRSQAHIVSPRVTESTPENSGRAVISVREGLLLLFPAWLSHSVASNPSDKERISVSFNLMFSSFTEKVSPVKWEGNLAT